MLFLSIALIGHALCVHSIDWSCSLCPNIDWPCCLCPQSGETPVHVAVRFCHLQVMKTLLNYVSKNKSHIDAVLLVNQASYVSSCVLLYHVSCSNVFLNFYPNEYTFADY